MNDHASTCIEQIRRLGFKPGTQLNIFCSRCTGSIKTFSDKPDEAEIQKFLANHTGHDCFFGFNDGRKWKIQNDGGIESDRPQRIEPTIETATQEEPLPKSNPEPDRGKDTIPDPDIFEGDPFEDETWIKLYRKFIKNPIFKDSASVHLWLYLLLKANHKSNRFLFNKKEISVKRGQLVTGLHKISKDTGISEWRVRERLKAFEALDMTTSKTTNKFRIITVCNYSEYQDSISEKPQAKPQAVDSTKLYPNPQSTHNKQE